MNPNLNPNSPAANPLVIERIITDAATRMTKGAELFRRGLVHQTDQPGVYEAIYTINLNSYSCTCPDFKGKACSHIRTAIRHPYLLTATDDPNIFLCIYIINLLERSCTCPDFGRHEGCPCKHAYGAEMLERVLKMMENTVSLPDDIEAIDFAA